MNTTPAGTATSTLDEATIRRLRNSPSVGRFFDDHGNLLVRIHGGADGDGAGSGSGDGAGAGGGAGDGGSGDGVAGDGGDGQGTGDGDGAGVDDAPWPANTPVAEMTAVQQAAYWRDKSQKHEKQSKANLTELDKIRRAGLSTDEQKLEEARDAGRAEVMATVGARLVDAEIKASAAGRLDDKQRTALLEGLDRNRFLTDDGDVDTDKVEALIEGIAGPKSAKDEPKTKFPGLGQGKRTIGDTTPSVAAGKDRYAERHAPKK